MQLAFVVVVVVVVVVVLIRGWLHELLNILGFLLTFLIGAPSLLLLLANELSSESLYTALLVRRLHSPALYVPRRLNPTLIHAHDSTLD